MGSTESGQLVALATTEEALKNWYESQKLEKRETIDGWNYSFKEGPIRYNNPLYKWKPESQDVFRHGWFDEWVNINEISKKPFRVDF
ncbi:MAG TPA: hypothetical protein VK590_13990 [Saprospiraceae bacterium]|nr:hypothetical protein [Saprospiraceae bacterium]